MKHLARRKAAERRFRYMAGGAVMFSAGMLVVLLCSIILQSLPAFTSHTAALSLAPQTEEAPAEALSAYHDQAKAALARAIGADRAEPETELELNQLLSRLSLVKAQEQLENAAGPARLKLVLSDDADIFLERLSHEAEPISGVTGAQDSGAVLLVDGPNVYCLIGQAGGGMQAERLAGIEPWRPEAMEQGRLLKLTRPEAERALSDRQAAWLISLKAQGLIDRRFNTNLFTRADSAYPELAGIVGALAGTILLLIVAACVAMPAGLASAVYLEEFAPQNAMTRFLELFINNLAAVPSIIFGLFGAAVLINYIGMPRSVPLVGGIILGLIAYPTIVLSARSALGAVPNSVRDASFGIGASRGQTVWHHTLPQAAPGIVTGAIIAFARAIGESAPLLLIGMVAFVADVPRSVTEEATALPVLIYSWSTSAERAWQPAAAAAILILLAIMFAMSAAALIIRQRYQRRRP